MNEVYRKIDDMYRKSTMMHKLAYEKDIDYDRSVKIREDQTKVYKKLEFYKGFVKAINKRK